MKLLSKVILFTICVINSNNPFAETIKMTADEARESSELIASLLVAGRGVVAKHQGLINDPSKGDKGFTPDYVDKLIREDFQTMTGQAIADISSPATRQALEATLSASRDAVKNNQGRINVEGKAFKGFIPAVYGRITGNILKGRTGITIKQTTFKYRNEYNKPDGFEETILKKFEAGEQKGGYGEAVNNEYRYLKPIYIKEACLKCHGEPKGELDIAGKEKEGYKVGDLRGAISVLVPIAQ